MITARANHPRTEAAMRRIRPILAWPGGKSRMLKLLLPEIARRPHAAYVEVCAGGLAVLLAKPRSPVEVVNDANAALVALYRNVQYHLPALLDELEWILNARKNLVDFCLEPGLTEIQRAARFLVRHRISFAGGGRSYGVTRTQGGGANTSREMVMEVVRQANRRLDRVSVEHLPYERCLQLYDAPQTLFFIDPPYTGCVVPGRAYEPWTEEQMRELRGRLDQLAGDWLLTVNDSPFTRALFADCAVTPVRSTSGAVNRAKRPGQIFGELLVARRRSRCSALNKN